MTKEQTKQRIIEHVWSVLCTASSVDSKSNNVTLFNVLEQLGVTRKKDAPQIDVQKGEGLPFQMELVSLWKKNGVQDNALGEVITKFLDPMGKELGSMKMPLEIKTPQKRMRTLMQVHGITITTPGYYTWRVFLNIGGSEEVVAEVPLEIVISQEK